MEKEESDIIIKYGFKAMIEIMYNKVNKQTDSNIYLQLFLGNIILLQTLGNLYMIKLIFM